MSYVATAFVLLVAALHVGFLVLEMFLWSTPIGKRAFGLPAEAMVPSARLVIV
jgi:putative membrane protein